MLLPSEYSWTVAATVCLGIKMLTVIHCQKWMWAVHPSVVFWIRQTLVNVLIPTRTGHVCDGHMASLLTFHRSAIRVHTKTLIAISSRILRSTQHSGMTSKNSHHTYEAGCLHSLSWWKLMGFFRHHFLYELVFLLGNSSIWCDLVFVLFSTSMFS